MVGNNPILHSIDNYCLVHEPHVTNGLKFAYAIYHTRTNTLLYRFEQKKLAEDTLQRLDAYVNRGRTLYA